MENFNLFSMDWVEVVETRTSLVQPAPGTTWTLCTTAVAQSVDRKHMVLETQWVDLAEDKERRCHDHHSETSVAETFLCPKTSWAWCKESARHLSLLWH